MVGRRRFGRVRKLPSGRWQACFSTPDGRDHSAPSTFATKTAANRWLAAVETDMAQVQGPTHARASCSIRRQFAPARADLKIRTRELHQMSAITSTSSRSSDT